MYFVIQTTFPTRRPIFLRVRQSATLLLTDLAAKQPAPILHRNTGKAAANRHAPTFLWKEQSTATDCVSDSHATCPVQRRYCKRQFQSLYPCTFDRAISSVEIRRRTVRTTLPKSRARQLCRQAFAHLSACPSSPLPKSGLPTSSCRRKIPSYTPAYSRMSGSTSCC